MIPAVIRWSLANRFLVLALALALTIGGVWAARETPIDAIPDLSDVQVIVKTPYPGQAPQVVEDQITYPIATAMNRAGFPGGCFSLATRPSRVSPERRRRRLRPR
ncbi:efflux RND transporter permease subunit, partial [Rubrimonas cliftonensis]